MGISTFTGRWYFATQKAEETILDAAELDYPGDHELPGESLLSETAEKDREYQYVEYSTGNRRWISLRDKEFGGIFSFVDVEGKHPAQVEWDMKYWWPHCEAIIAFLQAYDMTGEQKYLDWFDKIHDYTWTHFQIERQESGSVI